MPRRLLLIRHGQSTWNADGRWQGRADPPLSALGEAQAADAADAATGAGAGLTGVASSDLQRASRTAEIMAGVLGLGEVVLDAELREYDVGEWCGFTRPEIEARWPTQLAQWREGRLIAPPGGEPRDAFAERVHAAVTRLVTKEHLGDQPLVVTHGGVIRTLVRCLGDEPAPVPNLAGHWFEVDATGHLHTGEPIVLVDPERRTASPSP